MRTSSITVFCKQAACPSAETLLSYHSLSRMSDEAEWVTEHLDACEFCGAELRLLTEHSTAEEEFAAVEIPAHLRSLAEALLRGTELAHFISQSEISYERERLTLTDA